jgi:hypothetical protein
MKFAILAFGSLIDDPGEDLAPVIVEKRPGAITPFNVEFSHASALRDGAPTLTPVTHGGAPIEAVLLVLKEEVSIETAIDFLYARETGRPGSGAQYQPDPLHANQIYIDELPFFLGFTAVIFARATSNIEPLTADELARRSIASAWGPAGALNLDGIRYLMDAKKHGVQTPLMNAYERRILEITGEADLAGARERVRQAVAMANV